MAMTDSIPQPDEKPATARLTYRHTLPVRIFHWFNALCLLVLLMSGMQIFNAHPTLYWGERSDPQKALLALESGFPGWATLPSQRWLAMGRRWHLFFAWLLVINGVIFTLYALASRHLDRDLLPRARELRGIRQSIGDHLRLRHAQGEAATRYNVLQKLSYLVVIFGLGPLIVMTGLAMSPWLDAAFPWLISLFDGRQSARTVHFAAAFALLAFAIVHILMVIVSGPLNHLRGMITGWYQIREQRNAHDQ